MSGIPGHGQVPQSLHIGKAGRKGLNATRGNATGREGQPNYATAPLERLRQHDHIVIQQHVLIHCEILEATGGGTNGLEKFQKTRYSVLTEDVVA